VGEVRPPPIRTILVGVRGRGTWTVDRFVEDPRFVPVALVGREPAALADARTATHLGDDRCFASLAAALDMVDCDAVTICTPTDLHARDALLAFAAGKHVLVEKAIAPTWAESCAVVQAAEAARVALVVGQNYRFRPEALTLRDLVANGDFGSTFLIDLIQHKYRPAPRQQNYPFGMVWDMSVHHFDDLQWIFGPIVEVSAETFTAPWSQYRDPAAVNATLRFASGSVCTYALSNIATIHDYRCVVQTERGAFRWRREQWEFLEALAPPDAPFGWNAPPVAVAAAPHPPTTEHGLMDAFAAAILTGAVTPISGRPNLETLRVCEMVVRSATRQQPVGRDEVVEPDRA
jgi:predicted dehydrogenase